MFHKLLSICLILLSHGVSADELIPTKSGMYDVGGFSLYLECYENDKPKLILEQGFGRSGSDGVWLNNIKELKGHYSICLYDRSGPCFGHAAACACASPRHHAPAGGCAARAKSD